jgi:hypothetical protein
VETKVPPVEAPHLIAALICERILHELDGSLSAIRIVDSLVVSLDPKADLSHPPTMHIKQQMLLVLQAGEFEGEAQIEVNWIPPSGIQGEAFRRNFPFERGSYKRNLIVNLLLSTNEPGIHWFPVIINGKERTRVAVELVYLTNSPAGTAAKNSENVDLDGPDEEEG